MNIVKIVFSLIVILGIARSVVGCSLMTSLLGGLSLVSSGSSEPPYAVVADAAPTNPDALYGAFDIPRDPPGHFAPSDQLTFSDSVEVDSREDQRLDPR